MHLCLPELEQRTQAPMDARAFARLMPAEFRAVQHARAVPAVVVRSVAVERSDGPPGAERRSLSSTVMLV